jgi:hypothetical protein
MRGGHDGDTKVVVEEDAYVAAEGFIGNVIK